MACVLFDSNRAVRGAFQRHNATDLQEEKVVVQSSVLQPPAERPRETLRNPEVRHEAGQKTAGCDAGPHRCTGERLIINANECMKQIKVLFIEIIFRMERAIWSLSSWRLVHCDTLIF